MRQSILIATILCSALSGPVLAAEPTALLDNYAAQARQQDPNFTGFSGERGKALYFRKALRDDKNMSCTTCHGADPLKAGKTLTFRKIEPWRRVLHPLVSRTRRRWKSGSVGTATMCLDVNAALRKRAISFPGSAI